MRAAVYTGIFIIITCLACSTAVPDPKDTVIENYRALDAEDIGLYMATVSGLRADIAGDLLPELFKDYDISYTIDSIEVISNEDSIAEVRTVVTARNEGGPKRSHDNRMTACHKLHFQNGRWTIENTEVSDLQMLGQDEPASQLTDTAAINRESPPYTN